jgi:hypothetical protein
MADYLATESGARLTTEAGDLILIETSDVPVPTQPPGGRAGFRRFTRLPRTAFSLMPALLHFSYFVGRPMDLMLTPRGDSDVPKRDQGEST